MDAMIEPAAFEEMIRARAYALWESEGRPVGRDAEHWRRSEEEFMRVTAFLPAPACPVDAKAEKPKKKKKAAKKA